MKVIITEKPSVAKNIADAMSIKNKKDGYYEGEGYFITWAFGHLLQLFDARDYDEKYKVWKMDNFPFIPPNFSYKIRPSMKNKEKPDTGVKKQLNIIHTLIKKKEVTSVISACDYDREGQIIGDIILSYLKVNKPVERLLLNEWTKNEVVKGLANLKSNNELQPLSHAGLSRQLADWLIGINLTSVATLKFKTENKKLINIGRVLLPTLKIIYDREKEIENFNPEKYYKLKVSFSTSKGESFDSFYREDKATEFKEDKYLKEINKLITKGNGKITSIDNEIKQEYPPYLFNLSGLQGYITSKYTGWSSDKVLKVAQSLYEKKLITYPRTASIVLEETLIGKTKSVFETHKKVSSFISELNFHTSKRVFNSAKVQSHSAIIPTYVLPKKLDLNEKIVYEAIVNRFLMQFMPIAKVEETIMVTELQGLNISGDFLTKGKLLLEEGWKKIEKIETKEVFLPKVEIQELVTVLDSKVENHQTKPPKLHTEKTLLKVMETCGKSVKSEEFDEDSMEAILSGYSIGTPATRAETIKRLKDIGYISIKNKNLVCTPFGKQLVEFFPVKELFDINFTGRLEKALSEIEKANYTKDEFLTYINRFIIKAVGTIKKSDSKIETVKVQRKSRVTNPPKKIKETVEKSEVIELNQEVTEKKIQKTFEGIGPCPICNHPIIKGKKGFGCSNYKNGCKFVIWNEDEFLEQLGIEVNELFVKNLLPRMSFNWQDKTILFKYDTIKWQGKWELK